jgi:hypothetical protein
MMTFQDLVDLVTALVCAGFCTSVVFIPIIVFWVRSINRETRQFRAAQARGAFADINEQPTKSKIRIYAAIALIGLLGMGITFLILVIQLINNATKWSIPLLVVTFIFGAISSVAGMLINRESDYLTQWQQKVAE